MSNNNNNSSHPKRKESLSLLSNSYNSSNIISKSDLSLSKLHSTLNTIETNSNNNNNSSTNNFINDLPNLLLFDIKNIAEDKEKKINFNEINIKYDGYINLLKKKLIEIKRQRKISESNINIMKHRINKLQEQEKNTLENYNQMKNQIDKIINKRKNNIKNINNNTIKNSNYLNEKRNYQNLSLKVNNNKNCNNSKIKQNIYYKTNKATNINKNSNNNDVNLSNNDMDNNNSATPITNNFHQLAKTNLKTNIIKNKRIYRKTCLGNPGIYYPKKKEYPKLFSNSSKRKENSSFYKRETLNNKNINVSNFAEELTNEIKKINLTQGSENDLNLYNKEDNGYSERKKSKHVIGQINGNERKHIDEIFVKLDRKKTIGNSWRNSSRGNGNIANLKQRLIINLKKDENLKKSLMKQLEDIKKEELNLFNNFSDIFTIENDKV